MISVKARPHKLSVEQLLIQRFFMLLRYEGQALKLVKKVLKKDDFNLLVRPDSLVLSLSDLRIDDQNLTNNYYYFSFWNARGYGFCRAVNNSPTFGQSGVRSNFKLRYLNFLQSGPHLR